MDIWKGSCTSDKVVKIANIKYPPEDGFKVIWIFDNSKSHNAYSDDALIVAHMNAKLSWNLASYPG